FTGGSGQPRDAAIETVENNGQSDRLRCVIKMPGLGHRGMRDLENGEVSEGDVRRSKQRWQDVHASSHSAGRAGFLSAARDLRDFVVHHTPPRLSDCAVLAATGSPVGGKRASTLLPPLTRSPTLTCRLAELSSSTSIREPNFIIPIRSPRATLSPTFLVNT